MEQNKCSFKGFLRIIECIVAAEEAVSGSITLCDIPMASILDDPSFRSKVKKHSAKIRRCIEVIHRNRAEAERVVLEIEVEAEAESVDQKEDHKEDDDHKEEDEDRAQSPAATYTVAHTALSNVDKLAAMMSASNAKFPKIRKAKPIEDVPLSAKQKSKAPAKVVKSGMDALIDKGSADAKAQNAKSRRKKRTRKRIAV